MKKNMDSNYFGDFGAVDNLLMVKKHINEIEYIFKV